MPSSSDHVWDVVPLQFLIVVFSASNAEIAFSALAYWVTAWLRLLPSAPLAFS